MPRNIIKFYNTCVVLFSFLVFYIHFTFFTTAILREDLLRISRISLIVIPVFFVISFLIIKSYSSNYVENRRKIEFLFYSIVTMIISDTIAYLQICIMLKQISFALVLISCVIFQTFIVTLISYVFFKTVNKTFKKQKAILIVGNLDTSDRFIMKCKDYCKQYKLTETYHYSEETLFERILTYDAVFLYEIPADERERIALHAIRNHLKVSIVPNLFEILVSTSNQELIDDSIIIYFERMQLTRGQRVIKRTFDIVFSIIAILVFFVPTIFIAIAIKAEDGGPVFFRQDRVSRMNKVFSIFKFRTMIVDAEKDGEPLPCTGDRDPRITKVGYFLRKTRLDEVPQFINVLTGEMSVVGPRPERIEHVTKYEEELPEFSYRLQVKSGLTGLAQIYGKYNTTPKDKLALDLYYIHKYSIFLDMSMILQTASVLWKKESTQGFESS